jgi:hypothetical protein
MTLAIFAGRGKIFIYKAEEYHASEMDRFP